MPPAKPKKQPEPKRDPRPPLTPGIPIRVTHVGVSRDFLSATCTTDENGLLYVLRVLHDREPYILCVYAPGAWDSFEPVLPVDFDESRTKESLADA